MKNKAAIAFIEAHGLDPADVVDFTMAAGSRPVFTVLNRNVDWTNGPVTRKEER